MKRAIPDASRRALALLACGGSPREDFVIRCALCGKKGRGWWPCRRDGQPGGWVHFTLEIDHKYPEALGGASTPDNLQFACAPCNRRKGARL